MSSGRTLSSAIGVKRSGGDSTGALSTTGSRGGGGLTILLPDCAGALDLRINTRRERRMIFFIARPRERLSRNSAREFYTNRGSGERNLMPTRVVAGRACQCLEMNQ